MPPSLFKLAAQYSKSTNIDDSDSTSGESINTTRTSTPSSQRPEQNGNQNSAKQALQTAHNGEFAELIAQPQDLMSSTAFSSPHTQHASSAPSFTPSSSKQTPFLSTKKLHKMLDDLRGDSGYQTGVATTEDGISTGTGVGTPVEEFYDAEDLPEASGDQMDYEKGDDTHPDQSSLPIKVAKDNLAAMFSDDENEDESTKTREPQPANSSPFNFKLNRRIVHKDQDGEDAVMEDVDDSIEDSEAEETKPDEPLQFFRLGESEDSDIEEFEEARETVIIKDDSEDGVDRPAHIELIGSYSTEDEDEEDEGPTNPHLRSPRSPRNKKGNKKEPSLKELDDVTGIDEMDGFIVSDSEDELEEECVEVNDTIAREFKIETIKQADVDTKEKEIIRKRKFAGVIPIGLRNPKSIYEGWTAPFPIVKEFVMIEDCKLTPGDGYGYVHIDRFEIYSPSSNKKNADEFVGLNMLNIGKGHNELCIDAVVKDRQGQPRYFLRGARFNTCAVGNYCDSTLPSVGDKIWVQTKVSKFNYTYYQLGRPSKSYAEYFRNFYWIANLAKYVIDYIADNEEDRPGHNYRLIDFQSKFSQWLEKTYGSYPEYRQWKSQHPSNDFRQALVANKEYVWKEAFGVHEDEFQKFDLWKELQNQEFQRHVSPKVDGMKTVVTPLVYDIFKDAFGPYLKTIPPRLPKGEVLKTPEVVVASPERLPRTENGLIKFQMNPKDVKVGSMIGIQPEKNTRWKTGDGKLWYAYVHEIIPHKKDYMQDIINVVWLYLPGDTILKDARYPYHQEIFFSDHCNCDESPPLRRSEVTAIFSVAFFCGPGVSGAEFFIRQKFLTATGSFTTLHEKDLKECGCDYETDPYLEVLGKYKVKDTVLVKSVIGKRRKVMKSGNKVTEKLEILEPAIIEEFVEETKTVRMRTFYRRKRDFNGKKNFLDSAPNHLVLSTEITEIEPQFIVRPCRVRCFAPDQKIPAPYCYGGTGDCFFVTELMEPKPSDPSNTEGEVKPETTETEKERAKANFVEYPGFEVPFNQGYDLNDKPIGDLKPMAGMDLYCGGGNFGRGLEEGGAIQNKWAVDYEAFAVHTYKQNLRHDTAVYFGSVNDFLRAGLTGEYETGGKSNPYTIPKPGEVDFISAGSPCQGFSNANQKKYNEKSMINASLVASVASFVDFFRPKYALLENVLGIASTRKHVLPHSEGKEVEYNVYSMMLTAIIAMGYQVNMFVMDAWSHGGPQSRTRMFLEITAPGHTVPNVPPRSHSHPARVKGYALKEAPNGGRYAARELEGPCPFPFVTIGEACKDLPWLGDTHVNSCIQFPDHRSSRIEDREKRMLMRCIPKYKSANGMVDAIRLGYVPETLQLYPGVVHKTRDGSKSWRRCPSDEIVRTITTALQPSCAFTGQWMHWQEHRLLTVMEARRAQGFPDDEVLNASAADAFMICGNSVARQVSVALGIQLREAWMQPRIPPDAPRSVPPKRRRFATPEHCKITDVTEEMTEAITVQDKGRSKATSPPPQLRQSESTINVPKTPSQSTPSKRKTTVVVDQDEEDEIIVISETQLSNTPSTNKRKRPSPAPLSTSEKKVSAKRSLTEPGPQDTQPLSKRPRSQLSSISRPTSTTGTPSEKRLRGRPKKTPSTSQGASNAVSPSSQNKKSSFFRNKERPITIDDSPEPEPAPKKRKSTQSTPKLSKANLSSLQKEVTASASTNKRAPTPDSLVSEEVKSTELIGVDADGIELW